MKNVRYVMFVYGLILTFLLSACGTPTPVVIVVTATSLPPTEAPVAEPTSNFGACGFVWSAKRHDDEMDRWKHIGICPVCGIYHG